MFNEVTTRTSRRALKALGIAFAVCAFAAAGFVAANAMPVDECLGTGVQLAHAKTHKVSVKSKNIKVKSLKTQYYNGKARKPGFKVYYKNTRLKKNKQYTVKYSNNVALGTAKVTITAKNKTFKYQGKTYKLKGKRTVSFKIKKPFSVKLTRLSYVYTGKQVKPSLKVYYKETKLTKGTHYDLELSDNIEVGAAKAVVVFKGKYAWLNELSKGSRSIKYIIGGSIIDVSEHDGKIDWEKTSSAIDVAILRSYVTYSLGDHAHKKAGDGQWRQDTSYESNAAGCEANNVPYGAYAYLVYYSEQDARDQADAVWKASFVDGHAPLYIVADLEDSLMNKQGAKVATYTRAFFDRIQYRAKKAGYENGIKTGLYIGGHCYATFGFAKTAGIKVIDECIDFVWVPAYGKNTGGIPSTTYEPAYDWDMWQYTSVGKVSGISTNVDMSFIRTTGPKKRSLGWYKKR